MQLRKLVDQSLIAAALALGVYLIATSDHPTQAEISAREHNVLPAFNPEEVTELRWEGPETYRLFRDPDESDTTRYFLGQRGGREVAADVVREVLSALELATWQRRLGEKVQASPAEFGFDRPQLEFRIEAGPRSYRLLFGSQAPGNPENIYLLIEGHSTASFGGLVKKDFLRTLDKRRQEFLGGLVFPLLRSETSALTLTPLPPDTQSPRKLIAQEHGFVLPSDTGGRLADRALSDLIFFQLARTKVSTYVDETSKYDHLLEVVHEGVDGTRYRARLGAPCPSDPTLSIVAQRIEPEPLHGCVPGSILTALQLDEQRLLARTATVMNADEIDHVIVEREGKTLDIIRDGGEYKLLSRRSEVIPHASGDEFLRGLSSASLIWLADIPQGTSKIGRIQLKGNIRTLGASDSEQRGDRAYQTAIEIHRGGAGSLLIKREADAAWFEVPGEHTWLFSAEDGWARSPTISTWDAQDISQITITLGGMTRYTVKRSGEDFILESPEKRTADPGLSRNLFSDLASLKAVRFLAENRERPQDGLVQVDFEVKHDDSKKKVTLWVGGRTRGGYLAWCSEAEGTFVLAPEVLTTLETPLVDRRDFHINPEHAAVLELVTGDARKFVFERDAEVLRARGGEANDDMIEPLLLALRNIAVVSAAGNHPDAQAIKRGAPILSIHAHAGPDPEGRAETRTLRFGSPTIWQGIPAHISWIEGKNENYFVSRQSLLELLTLL